MFANSTFARNAVAALGAVVIAGTCLTVAASPAAAAQADAIKTSKVVTYADLNLSNQHGRATLDARIRAAAHSVCDNQGYDLASRIAETRCVKAAISNANVS